MKKNLSLFLAVAVIATIVSLLTRATEVGAQQATDSAPIGSIVAWPGAKTKIPKGWRECDGSEVDKNQFKVLADRLGTFWGGTATDKIKLPDLRGYFLRGVSGSSDVDPDKMRRSPRGSGTSNDVGSIQNDIFGAHSHTLLTGGTVFTSTPTATSEWKSGFAPGDAFRDNGASGVSRSPINENGGKETRPKNANVYWIIRIE
ncbi:MAG TPA: phage tail protein [Pyrinomonadaceae bacterium]|jgi:microcystin-dependent protein